MGDSIYNYKVSPDNGNAEMYCITDAAYQEAFELFSKWFERERYSGKYKDLEDFMQKNGYSLRERGLNNDNATLINLNNINFEQALYGAFLCELCLKVAVQFTIA